MRTSAYEIYALRYASRAGRRPSNFIDGDPHDISMPMDYFIWLVKNDERLFVIDTGFTAEMATKRSRQFILSPREALLRVGVKAESVLHVVITHLHYDHVGTFSDFPNARFYIQDEEMAYATGRNMLHKRLSHSYEVEDVVGIVRSVFDGRVVFCSGSRELAPGITVHRIGGHTAGLQVVRIFTKRGWVVIASDAAHFYENMETGRCFPNVFHIGEMLEGYDILRRLAESPEHVIPGHDPLVMQRYPPISNELKEIGVRLDVLPYQ